MSDTTVNEALAAAHDDTEAEAPPVPEPQVQAPEPPAPAEPESVLKRKIGTRDLGWLNRIYVKGRNEVRRKARNGELEEEGYEADDDGNYPGIDLMAMIMLSWGVVEKDLNLWTADLTGKTPEECSADLTILMAVADEIEASGSFGPLMSLLTRLQGRGLGGGQATSSPSTESTTATDGPGGR